MRHQFSAAVFVALLLEGCAPSRRPSTVAAPRPTTASPTDAPLTERVVGPLSPADARVLATFSDRVNAYVRLRGDMTADLPPLSNQATAAEIEANRLGFEQRLRTARASARPGDVFTADAAATLKRLLSNVFSSPGARQLRASIADVPVPPFLLAVNARYPIAAPVATMPPEILQTLPALPPGLDYRFVDHALILLDTRARIVVDYIDDALPR